MGNPRILLSSAWVLCDILRLAIVKSQKHLSTQSSIFTEIQIETCFSLISGLISQLEQGHITIYILGYTNLPSPSNSLSFGLDFIFLVDMDKYPGTIFLITIEAPILFLSIGVNILSFFQILSHALL